MPVRSFQVVEAPLIELTSFASKLKIAPDVIGPAVALERSFGTEVIGKIVISDAIKHAKTGDRDFEVRIGHPQEKVSAPEPLILSSRTQKTRLKIPKFEVIFQSWKKVLKGFNG